jgi:predicted AlkP superfamily phosphohydrolase/phosphomutase
MPATYPARKINGALISGFVAVDIDRAVYPRSLLASLKESGYRIDIDTARARQDHDFLFRELSDTVKCRERAVDLLWSEFDWHLFIVVITGTDRLMHFLWGAYEDVEHPYHQAFLDYFGEVDGFIGRIYGRFLDLAGSENGTNQFFMLSDHGFTHITTEVYLNYWLEKHGYLKFAKDQPETVMDIGPGSMAFALDPSRIYINSKGKYPQGEVESSDYERVRRELKEALGELSFDDGTRIAQRVYLREELYSGPCVDRAPDLVVLGRKGFDLKGKVNSEVLFGRTVLAGMHSQDDAFFFSSGGYACTSIFDAGETILQALQEA